MASDHEDLDLSVVIPAYNESAKITADVHAAFAFISRSRLSGEVVVVDDGSSDETAAVATALMEQYPNLLVLSYAPNRGKGHALRCGVMRTSGRTVLFADSGLCVPYDIATIGLTMLSLGMCDIAHGSRRMRGSVKRAQPLYRRVGSQAFKLFVHSVMGIPAHISDTQCGFKLYRRSVAHDLYGAAFTDGFMFDSEIILRALRRGYEILEFPVIWSNDSDTRYDPVRGTVRNLRELLSIRLALLRGEAQSTATAKVPLE